MQLNNIEKSDYNITIPLIYSIIENHEYDNVILIHDKINNPQEFVLYANSKSLSIIYNESSSNDELIELLNKYFTNIKRISFVFHNTNIDGLKGFTNNKPLFDINDLEINTIDYSLNMQFVINIANQFNVENLDYLACNTLLYEHWKKYFDILKVKTTATIGASNDETGNIKYGGDWVLENTNEDIRNIYFTDSVENYQYTLAESTLILDGGTITMTQTGVPSIICTLISSTTNTTQTIGTDNWPVRIINTSTTNDILTVVLSSNISFRQNLGGTNGYFIFGSNNITINGNNKLARIDNNVSGHPGVFQNGTSTTTQINPAFTGIIIKDLGSDGSNNTGIGDNAGWICQSYFGAFASSGNITVNNCYSIRTTAGGPRLNCGGIFGSRAGYSSSVTITVNNCFSTGGIGDSGGGIFGSHTGASSLAIITVNNSYSSGGMTASNSGGIFGAYAGDGSSSASSAIITANYCYYAPTIGLGSCGGIFGSYAGYSSSATIKVNNCYSLGLITGSSGGIFGPGAGAYSAAPGYIEVNNCFSIGNMQYAAGGIFGEGAGINATPSGSIIVNNCYSTGGIGDYGGGIMGHATGRSSACNIKVNNCYSRGSIAIGGGGIFGYDTGNAGTTCKIEANNCYTIGSITSSSGGIFGQNTLDGNRGGGTVKAINCYTIGSFITPNTGIYGTFNNGGTTIKCIFVGGSSPDVIASPTQTAGTWYDSNANLTINQYTPSQNIWTDINSLSSSPWLLSSFNSNIYNPNSYTSNPLDTSTYTTSPGLFQTTYTYSIIKVNNSYTIPSNISISTTTGRITFTTPSTSYIVDVLVGKSSGSSSYEYNINSFTYTYDNIQPTMSILSTTISTGTSTNVQNIVFTFTSSESTTNFDISDITVTNGNLSNFSGSETTYTATFNAINNGQCILVVPAGVYTDIAGNSNIVSNTFTYTFDNISPTMTISSTTITTGGSTNAQNIVFTFTSSESTTNFVISDITVTNGILSNFSGSGTTYTATFNATTNGVCTLVVPAGVYTDSVSNSNTVSNTFTYTFRPVESTLTQNGGTITLNQDSTSFVITCTLTSGTQTITSGNWPVRIVNTSTTNGILTIVFDTNIVFNTSYGNTTGYFKFGSNNITINGNNKIVNINGIGSYPGLFQNGTSSTNGFTNIIIRDLGVVTSNGSTLASSGGWIGQSYFVKGISSGSITVTNCYSTGNISTNAGGIFGSFVGDGSTAGSITVTNCYSTGNISNNAGGIFGQYVKHNSGAISIISSNCYSTGTIGSDAGGIFGRSTGESSYAGSITVTNCYSTGNISSNAGGIFGRYSRYGSSSMNITSSNCYSTGIIGQYAGGIFGASAGDESTEGNITSSYCYSTGVIGNGGGGIFGSYAENANSGSIIASNCYSIGNIGEGAGGIFGDRASPRGSGNATISVINCYTIGAIGINAGGIFGYNSGAKKTNTYCIFVGGSSTSFNPIITTQTANNWIDDNANKTIQSSDAILNNPSKWIDYSSTNVPLLLASFNANIYSPNSHTSNPLDTSTYTTSQGLFQPSYTYSIIKVNNSYTIPDNININNNTTGAITFTTPSTSYVVDVLVSKGTAPSYYDYNINTFTYTYDPSCFNEGTKILYLNKNFDEEYIPIEKLKKGDLVKSYKHGYRKIDLICKNSMINNPDRFKQCMYKMDKTDDNGLLEDLIITGGHSILVDDLGYYTEETDDFFGETPIIDDKYLLLAAVSNDFKKIENTNLYTYYHFILENNGNDDERFGVWANGILTETPSKDFFMGRIYNLL